MSSLRWKKFFVESGLPSEVCENYAVIFSENRIRFDMLEELNKEILYDMGIKKMGDVISILRHAKEVHSSSFREKVFAKDEGNDSTKQENNSTYTKADSTIPSDNMKKSLTAAENRRIILPQRTESKAARPSPIRPGGGPPMRVVRKTAVEEPIVIRNVTGIRDVTGRKTSMGRNVTGLDPIDPPIMINRKKRIEPPNEELELSKKLAKTDLAVNPTIRNRIEAQSRLSNFSKEIQKVISSNSSSNSSTVRLLPSLTPQLLETTTAPVQGSVKARLTLNTADSTTITINRNATTLRNINVKSRLGNVATASSAATGSSKVKDRLGKKSVFSRVSLHSSTPNNLKSSSSVFKRLGA